MPKTFKTNSAEGGSNPHQSSQPAMHLAATAHGSHQFILYKYQTRIQYP
jgi:hypothetical protein